MTIGLSWGSINSSNLGLGALTECQLDILQDVADEIGAEIAFKVLFWADRTDPYVSRPNLEFVPFNHKFLVSLRKGMVSYARNADLVVDIAGGDSFTDRYGVRRFLYQSLSKAIPILAGARLILAPQTIGPFERPWARWVAAWVMRRCYCVATRDAMSSDIVRQLGAADRMIESTDVAFRLPYQQIVLAPTDKIRVGLNVSGLLFRGQYARDYYFALSVDYPTLIRTILTNLTARGDCEVHLVAHVVVPKKYETVEDDHRVAIALADEFAGVIVAPEFRTPSEAKSYISAMDVFAGSRMHACIAAFSAGVPVIPIAYSGKFEGLFATIGYDVVADCRTEPLEDIVNKLTDGIENRAELVGKVKSTNEDVKRRLARYSTMLRGCLAELGGLEVS